MNVIKKQLDNILPLTIGFWLGYLLILGTIDHLLYPRPNLEFSYYLMNSVVALGLLGVLWWPTGRQWLQTDAGIILIIALLSLTPIIAGTFIRSLPPPPAGPVAPPAATPSNTLEGQIMRQMPLLLMPLILVAWRFGRREVVLFSVGTALFALGIRIPSLVSGQEQILPPVTILLTQTVSFLVVGYFISLLIDHLRAQQHALQTANEQLTTHAATLEELTISRERNRMARELHDTLAHTLSALSVQLETTKAYWDVDPDAAHTMLESSLQATRSGLQETRRALKSLRASPLDDLGLAAALHQQAIETAHRANLDLQFNVSAHLPTLSSTVEQCLYRVAQEAMANVGHHANARTLSVELTVNHRITLRVKDDGRGFAPAQPVSAGHFGLAGMHERAALVGGVVTVNSAPGQGTEVRLDIDSY